MEKKRKIIQAVVCVGLVCLIWGGYFLAKREIDRKIQPYADDFSRVYQVDEVYMQGDEFILEGFVFEIGRNAEEGDFEIVLQDVESKKFYFPKTTWVKREDVNAYFLCEYDYTNSGFVASIKSKKLSLEENVYEVLVRLKDSKGAYCTGTYISDGGLIYTKEKEHLSLAVKDTELEQVVNEGVLRLSKPELGFYTYQYEGELYFVMEEKYKQQEEFLNRVVLDLNTTQISQLPQKRIELGATYDQIDLYFDDETKCGEYYVGKYTLPSEYSITQIGFGNYNNGHWVWKETIRPFYEFE